MTSRRLVQIAHAIGKAGSDLDTIEGAERARRFVQAAMQELYALADARRREERKANE